MIPSQLRVGHISKSIRLPFQGFDFIINTYNEVTGDSVERVIKGGKNGN